MKIWGGLVEPKILSISLYSRRRVLPREIKPWKITIMTIEERTTNNRNIENKYMKDNGIFE